MLERESNRWPEQLRAYLELAILQVSLTVLSLWRASSVFIFDSHEKGEWRLWIEYWTDISVLAYIPTLILIAGVEGAVKRGFDLSSFIPRVEFKPTASLAPLEDLTNNRDTEAKDFFHLQIQLPETPGVQGPLSPETPSPRRGLNRSQHRRTASLSPARRADSGPIVRASSSGAISQGYSFSDFAELEETLNKVKAEKLTLIDRVAHLEEELEELHCSAPQPLSSHSVPPQDQTCSSESQPLAAAQPPQLLSHAPSPSLSNTASQTDSPAESQSLSLIAGDEEVETLYSSVAGGLKSLDQCLLKATTMAHQREANIQQTPSMQSEAPQREQQKGHVKVAEGLMSLFDKLKSRGLKEKGLRDWYRYTQGAERLRVKEERASYRARMIRTRALFESWVAGVKAHRVELRDNAKAAPLEWSPLAAGSMHGREAQDGTSDAARDSTHTPAGQGGEEGSAQRSPSNTNSPSGIQGSQSPHLKRFDRSPSRILPRIPALRKHTIQLAREFVALATE